MSKQGYSEARQDKGLDLAVAARYATTMALILHNQLFLTSKWECDHKNLRPIIRET